MKVTEPAPAPGTASVPEPPSPPEFEEFFLAERQGLFGSLWLITHNRHEAEEILQEAFLRLWERWDRVRSVEDRAGYLYRTAMNVWRSRARRAAVAVRKSVRALPPDDLLREVDEREVVLRALAPLPRGQRAAIVLMDLIGLSSDEAARALGVRPSTVRVQAARARSALRERMSES